MKSFTLEGEENGIDLQQKEESGIVLWRRLVEDKEEPTVNKEAEEQYKEAQESSQNNTLPEDPEKETEEETGLVLWRRLIEDKEPTLNKETEEQHKETEESSQNTTEEENGIQPSFIAFTKLLT
ncbi:hypothetical protein SUGI_0420190 [Cryptomeria japonica]|nr:hypothetical protein SUGI_0420190 [Cryptomeria japonica]